MVGERDFRYCGAGVRDEGGVVLAISARSFSSDIIHDRSFRHFERSWVGFFSIPPAHVLASAGRSSAGMKA